jgi:tetratricopeptide (TPR) repeat protein
VEGYVAYRDPNKGSWYIQTLCDLISSSESNDEILHILTDVNSSLADREEVVVPTFNSRLTKIFYFLQQSSSNENIISKANEYFNKGLNATDLYQKIEFYSKSIELNPNDSDAYNNKGNAFGNLGRNEEAIKCYNKSIELNPNDSNALENRNILLRIFKKNGLF